MQADPAARFARPRRQSPTAILLILLKLARLLLRQGWPLLLVFLFNRKRSIESYLLGVALLIGIFSAIASLITYFKFFFYIKDEELIIRSGLFQKKVVNIPFDRIQSINLGQNLVHQLFNVVSLEIDTAGSAGKEATISALSKSDAQAIREYILARRSAAEDLSDAEVAVSPEASKEKILLRLSVKDLLKTGVSQNHLRALGILIAFGFGLLELLEDLVGKKRSDALLGQLFGTHWESVFSTLLLMIPFLLLIAMLLSLTNTVIRYFDLHLIRTEGGFRTIGGLFNRREQSAQLPKIQLLQWSHNPIKKLFNMVSLQIRQASSARQLRRQAMYVPACYPPQLAAVRHTYFPQEPDLTFTENGISRLIIFRRVLYRGLLPAVALVILFSNAGLPALLWLLWVPASWWLSHRYHKKWKYYLSREGLRVTKGLIGEQAALLKWSKVQAVRIRQSLYQQRKGLANIYFFTAAGIISIPYIDLQKAYKLKNYVLYKVEVDRRAWM